MKILTSLFLLSLTVSTFAADKAIYGGDTRQDLADSLDPDILELGSAVAAMIPRNHLISNAEETGFPQISLGQRMGTCSSERFSHQQSVAECSGFLVSPTHLVTAGHCVRQIEDCQRYVWVFDYQLGSENESSVGKIPNSEIYACKNIVKSKLTLFTKQDWAVIELDRPVTQRRPLALSKSSPARGSELIVIGTPSGLPLKVASGQVRSIHRNYFRTNLDTFGGNSGSPVFNATTKLVEGILVRGDTDYQNQGYCQIPAHYQADSGRGEEVTAIKFIRELLGN